MNAVIAVLVAVCLAVLALLMLALWAFYGPESNPWDSTDLQAQREFGRWKQRQIETKDDTR